MCEKLDVDKIYEECCSNCDKLYMCDVNFDVKRVIDCVTKKYGELYNKNDEEKEEFRKQFCDEWNKLYEKIGLKVC